MVVARRTPVAPAPSVSRSNSSNAASKPIKSKTSQPAPSTNNGKASPSTKNSKSPVTKKQKSTGSCHSRLFLLLLSAFAVYTVAVCPTDFPRTSPVCHSLDLYRAHILDPYIVPPIETLVHHANPYITPLKPYASSAAQFTRAHVTPCASAAIDFTVTQYQTHVAPRIYRVVVEQYWNGILKPTYYNNIHPHVEHHTRPYRIYYAKFIAPNSQKAISHVTTTCVRFWPYAEHYLSEVQRHTINAYETAQPYAIEAYRRVRPHAVRVSEQAKVHAIYLAGQAGDARRQFVDPHILQIWEKVRDLSATPSPSSSEISKPSAAQTIEELTPTPSESSIVSEPEPTQALHDEPTPSPSSAIIEPVVQTPEPEHADVASDSAPEPEPEQGAEPEAPAPSHEETATLTPSSSASLEPSPSLSEVEVPSSLTPVQGKDQTEIPVPSAVVSATPVPVAEHEAASAASVIAASLHVAVEPVIASEPEECESASTEDVNDFLEGLGLSSEPEPELKSQSTEAVEDFLKDIGVSADEPDSGSVVKSESESEPSSETQTQTQVQPEPDVPRPTYGDPPLSPEEKVAQTAQKRAAIIGRHERWQADLDALVRTELQSVRASLSVTRLTAVVHLAEWGPDKKGVVAEVESEAAKLLKGLEAYLQSVEDKAKKAPGVQARKEQRDRDREVWKKVLEKVEVRFTEKVRDLQQEVHEWYVSVQTQELKDIEAAAETVKALAERAQADLGLDYAWLDDVTYYDWQKYHDLMRTSENFTSQSKRIQGQTEPVGTNELVDALNELERDVNDLVDGFDVLVSNVIRRAEGGIFGPDLEPETTAESKTAKDSEPAVSILPTEPEEKVVVPVEDVFVGRAKEEVESKLAGVPVEDVRAGREEL